jgi:hypothetical protein
LCRSNVYSSNSAWRWENSQGKHEMVKTEYQYEDEGLMLWKYVISVILSKTSELLRKKMVILSCRINSLLISSK